MSNQELTIAYHDSSAQQIRIRNLKDVFRLLDQTDKELDQDTQALERYQRLFAHAVRANAQRHPRITLASIKVREFVIDSDSPSRISRMRKLTPIEKKEGTHIPTGRPKTSDYLAKLPNMNELRRQYEILDVFASKLGMLTRLEGELQYNFQGEKEHSAAVRELQALKERTRKKMDAAYKFVSSITAKVAPKKFVDLSEGIFDEVEKKLSDRFEKAERKLILRPSSKQNQDVVFANYLKLSNFTDEGGHRYKSYYVIFLMPIGVEEAGYYVTTNLAFVLPDKLPSYGVAVKDEKTAHRALQSLFSLEGMVDVFHDAPIPVETEDLDIFKRLPFVKTVVKKGNDLIFTLKAAPKDPDLILANLRRFVANALQLNHTNQVRTTAPKKVGAAWTVVVKIVPSGQNVLDQNTMDLLKQDRNLTDTEVRKMQRVLFK